MIKFFNNDRQVLVFFSLIKPNLKVKNRNMGGSIDECQVIFIYHLGNGGYWER